MCMLGDSLLLFPFISQILDNYKEIINLFISVWVSSKVCIYFILYLWNFIKHIIIVVDNYKIYMLFLFKKWSEVPINFII